jgi:flagellar protein FlaG
MRIDWTTLRFLPLGMPESPQQRGQYIKQIELNHAMRAVNQSEMFGADKELTFVLDRETRRPLLRLVDRRTGEVIRQIPQEYLMRMAEDLKRNQKRDAHQF